MPQLLDDLEIDEVAFVDRGAAVGARITIAKRIARRLRKGKSMNLDEVLQGLPDDARNTVLQALAEAAMAGDDDDDEPEGVAHAEGPPSGQATSNATQAAPAHPTIPTQHAPPPGAGPHLPGTNQAKMGGGPVPGPSVQEQTTIGGGVEFPASKGGGFPPSSSSMSGAPKVPADQQKTRKARQIAKQWQREFVHKKDAEIASMRERITKMEDENLTRTYVEKAASLTHVPVLSSPELGQVLKCLDMNRPVPQALAKKLWQAFGSMQAIVSKSQIFSEVGSSVVGGGGESAYGQAVAIAKTCRERDPKMSEAKAVEQAFKEHPDLYTRHLEESGRGNRA